MQPDRLAHLIAIARGNSKNPVGTGGTLEPGPSVQHDAPAFQRHSNRRSNICEEKNSNYFNDVPTVPTRSNTKCEARNESAKNAENIARPALERVLELCWNEPHEDAIEECAGLCTGSVPAIYLDAWARLNHQKPLRVSESEWRRALDDGGRFLDVWGWVSESEWAWTAAELFDVPTGEKPCGLIWRIGGAAVEAFGPEYARFSDGRIFKRANDQ